MAGQGYDAGGSLLPGRNYSSSSYNFGFNGMRKDDEIHGATGTSYDFGARLYDPRVGRWLSLDPKVKAGESPYVAFSNSPLFYVDPDGKDTLVVHRSRDFVQSGRAKFYRITFSVIRNGVQTALEQPHMWMFANAKAEKRGDNSLRRRKYFKMSQDLMSHHLATFGGDRERTEAELGREIRVGTYGNFIHSGGDADSFDGCFGVTCYPPLLPDEFPLLKEGQILGGADVPIVTRTPNGQPVEGGIHAMFRIYDEANAAGKLIGDKWLLQPGSESTSVERIEPREVRVDAAPLSRQPLQR